MRVSFLKTRLLLLLFLSIMLIATSCVDNDDINKDDDDNDDNGNPTSLEDPTGFSASVASETGVNLSWTGVKAATGYSLERKLEGGSYEEIEDKLSKDATSYEDTGLESGESYVYRLKTLKNSEKSKGVESKVVKLPAPGLPFNLTELEPMWLSKPLMSDDVMDLNRVVDAENAASIVSESGTNVTFAGAGEAMYYLGGECTQFSASGTGFTFFADDMPLTSDNGSFGIFGKQTLSIVYTGSGSATLQNPKVTCPDTPAAPKPEYNQGKWGSRFDWGTTASNKLVATHAANLPDGRVVTWSAWESLTFGEIEGLFYEYSEGFVWDPAKGTAASSFVEADNSGGGAPSESKGHDMFCAGLAMSPDGLVIGVGGGTDNSASLKRTSFFNFKTSSWDRGPDMLKDRWYATAVAMPDGSTFATHGDGSRFSSEILNASRSVWDPINLSKPLGEHPADYAFEDLAPYGSGTDMDIGDEFPTQEGWELTEARQWYPYLHVAPNGKLFQSGPIPRFNQVDLGKAPEDMIESVSTPVPTAQAQMRTWGNSVMINEGKLLVTGGSVVRGYAATRSGMLIDISSSNVQVKAIPDMRFNRSFHNSVVLPTGDVLMVGGNTTGKQMVDGSNGLPDGTNSGLTGGNNSYAPDPSSEADAANAKKRWPSDRPSETVYVAEVYSPTKNIWRDMAKMDTPRNYHSVALLLEDGRVLAAGGGLCGRRCPNNHPTGNIYEPAYLFNPDGSKAERPEIGSLGVSKNEDGYLKLGYGQQLTVTMNKLGSGAAISKFSLIKLSAVTHGINTDLRYLEFSEVDDKAKNRNQFEQVSPTSYKLTTTSNENVLIPGYYYLFAVNDKGVPSVAEVVQVE
ncbi:MAG: galactose oxidase-like domain-containing protein [Trueperaceae bacterium]